MLCPRQQRREPPHQARHAPLSITPHQARHALLHKPYSTSYYTSCSTPQAALLYKLQFADLTPPGLQPEALQPCVRIG